MAMRRLPSLRRFYVVRDHGKTKNLLSSACSFRQLENVELRNTIGTGSVLFVREYGKKHQKAKVVRKGEDDEEDDEEKEEEEEVEQVDVDEPKRTAKKQMEAALDALSGELGKLRTGRASAGMLDHIVVDMDGTNVSLNRLAAVSVANAQTLTVTPFDPTSLKKVEAAIRTSPLQLNPVPLEQIITVPVPRLSKDHVESMCKLAHRAGDAAKMSLRRARQTGMDHLKKLSKHIPKDELKRLEKEIEEITKQQVKAVDDACKKKENEISSGV